MCGYVYYSRNKINSRLDARKTSQNFSTFKFVTPYSPCNLPFNEDTSSNSRLNGEGYLRSKIYLRASILICHYFTHMRFLFKARPDDVTTDNRTIHCYIKRECSHIITLTKAPMAHKKFSREQYYFKYYTFVFQFKDVLHCDTKNPSSCDVIFINSSLNRLLRAIGTNLFFLQSCQTFYFFTSDVLL